MIGAEPCPSLLLQKHMAELLSVDKDMAASFLNSVLNQLNWAFSEFIGMIQEVSRRQPSSLILSVLFQRKEIIIDTREGGGFILVTVVTDVLFLLRFNRQQNVQRGTLWTLVS